jgi:hypothetical protein
MIYQRKRHDSDLIHSFKKLHAYIGIFLTFAVYITVINGFLLGKWNHLM